MFDFPYFARRMTQIRKIAADSNLLLFWWGFGVLQWYMYLIPVNYLILSGPKPFLLNENQLIMWEERFETCAMSCSHSAYSADATVYMYFDTRGKWVLTINYRKKHDLSYWIFLLSFIVEDPMSNEGHFFLCFLLFMWFIQQNANARKEKIILLMAICE